MYSEGTLRKDLLLSSKGKWKGRGEGRHWGELMLLILTRFKERVRFSETSWIHTGAKEGKTAWPRRGPYQDILVRQSMGPPLSTEESKHKLGGPGEQVCAWLSMRWAGTKKCFHFMKL